MNESETVRFVTYQHPVVLKTLDCGNTYYVTHTNELFIRAYMELKKYFNFDHLPIFLIPLDAESKFIVNDLLCYKDLSENIVRIVLDIPVNEYIMTEYLDWCDFLFYYRFGLTDESKNIRNYLDKKRGLYRVSDFEYPQGIIQLIKPEWIVREERSNG